MHCVFLAMISVCILYNWTRDVVEMLRRALLLSINMYCNMEREIDWDSAAALLICTTAGRTSAVF